MQKLPDFKTFHLPGVRPKVAFFHDILMAALSFVIALYLRLGPELETFSTQFIFQATVVYTAISAFVFWTMRLYSGVWQYASVEDLLSIVRAATTVVLMFFAAMFLVSRLEFVPRAALPINWLVLLALLGGPRFLYRLIKDRRVRNSLDRDQEKRIPVLLVGAGNSAELFIRAINRGRDSAWYAVGLVDDKGSRVGRNIHGINVLGKIGEIPEIVARLAKENCRPQRLIITKSRIEGEEGKKLLEFAEKLGIGLARMPQLDDFREDFESDLEIRPINIEDLLGRSQATLDRDSMAALIGGRRILVTGAGGTIGAELCRQIASFNPTSLGLLEYSEYQLYSIDLEFSENPDSPPREVILADIRDKARIDRIFEEIKPELVFHAAALKHVPMVELNPDEGALTNIIGTRIIADACKSNNVQAMVLISTDKAVNPTSIMGATKRIAESYCQALDIEEAERGPNKTRFFTVRFGNVLGSTGSVVPLFQRQLAAGGPLTVTHPDMKRYFMTVREAVELVLQASVQGINEQDGKGKIYVLDMGKPIKILDLARQIILLAGLKPDSDIKIKITGPRPGEKLFEEILHDSEELLQTTHPEILLAQPRTSNLMSLKSTIDEITTTARAGKVLETRLLIEGLVPEFKLSDIAE